MGFLGSFSLTVKNHSTIRIFSLQGVVSCSLNPFWSFSEIKQIRGTVSRAKECQLTAFLY